MDEQTFSSLDNTTQATLIFAMHIRNEMENFQRKHLTDEQMKELNPIIRQAIYDVLISIKNDATSQGFVGKPSSREFIHFLIRCIPDYWELPIP